MDRDELNRTLEQLYLKGLKEGRLEFQPGVSAVNVLDAIRRGDVWGLDERFVKVNRPADGPGGPPAKWSSEYLVWSDDMGAIHVGTLEQFHAIQKHKELAGGGTSDALVQKIPMLDGKSFTSFEEAMAALGREVAASGMKPQPLNDPLGPVKNPWTWGGLRLGSEITSAPGFARLSDPAPTPTGPKGWVLKKGFPKLDPEKRKWHEALDTVPSTTDGQFNDGDIAPGSVTMRQRKVIGGQTVYNWTFTFTLGGTPPAALAEGEQFTLTLSGAAAGKDNGTWNVGGGAGVGLWWQGFQVTADEAKPVAPGADLARVSVSGGPKGTPSASRKFTFIVPKDATKLSLRFFAAGGSPVAGPVVDYAWEIGTAAPGGATMDVADHAKLTEFASAKPDAADPPGLPPGYGKPGTPSPLGPVLDAARTALREHLNDPLPFTGATASSSADLKGEAQKAQVKAALSAGKLEGVLDDLKKAADDRAKEPSKRTRADYDLMTAALHNHLARLQQYNAALAGVRTAEADKYPNGIRIECTSPDPTDKTAAKSAAEARKLLDKVITDHPKTPWAEVAQHELAAPLGLTAVPLTPFTGSLTGDWTAWSGAFQSKVRQEKDGVVTMETTYTPLGKVPHYKFTGMLRGNTLTAEWVMLVDVGWAKKGETGKITAEVSTDGNSFTVTKTDELSTRYNWKGLVFTRTKLVGPKEVVPTVSELKKFDAKAGGVAAVAFLPDGKGFVTGDTYRVRVWDGTAEKPIRSQELREYGIEGFALSADGKRLVTTNLSGNLSLWDTATLKQHEIASGYGVGSSNAALSPDGATLVTVMYNAQALQVRDADTGKERFALKDLKVGAARVAVAPDGKEFAVGGGDWNTPAEGGRVVILDVKAGKERLAIKAGGGVWGLSYSPDGKRLAGACLDHVVRVWDTATGELAFECKGHTNKVLTVQFLPDGRGGAWGLASAGYDGVIRVWDAVTGKERARLEGHKGIVNKLSVNTAGDRLLSAGGEDGTVRLWELFPDKLKGDLKAVVPPK